MPKNSGFTLIEVTVVCLLIAILVGIGVPVYYRSVEIAKCRKATNTLKTMSSAAFAFYAENDTFTGLTVAAINAQSGVYIVNNDDWSYATAVPVDGNSFTITSTRLRGHHAMEIPPRNTIILNQDYVWSGTYPYADPGNF